LLAPLLLQQDKCVYSIIYLQGQRGLVFVFAYAAYTNSQQTGWPGPTSFRRCSCQWPQVHKKRRFFTWEKPGEKRWTLRVETDAYQHNARCPLSTVHCPLLTVLGARCSDTRSIKRPFVGLQNDTVNRGVKKYRRLGLNVAPHFPFTPFHI